MVKRKKILLRSEDLFGLENQDMFINVQVDNFSKDVRPETYDNDFDLQAQFDKERNSSREFSIYGNVKSLLVEPSTQSLKLFIETKPPTNLDLINDTTIFNTEGVPGEPVVKIYFENGSEAVLFQKQIPQTTFGSKNIFGFYECVYQFTFINKLSDGTEFDNVYLTYAYENEMQNSLIKQTLVYREPDGSVIDYGNETEEILDNGETYSVNNDFPFFYNIHWIKIPFEMKQ
jgi:hypothetical protein